ncbi:MAG: hypothetical protein NZM15_02145 [Flavobacteriales bacterium]|nr:hypothetical protein [Flavobacteriales bacterium]MDW8431486.1 hypothetical protein [Flavobacteriales bacterium]
MLKTNFCSVSLLVLTVCMYSVSARAQMLTLSVVHLASHHAEELYEQEVIEAVKGVHFTGTVGNSESGELKIFLGEDIFSSLQVLKDGKPISSWMYTYRFENPYVVLNMTSLKSGRYQIVVNNNVHVYVEK